MRYPHRIRLVDPRNRQPPQGVAYNALAYDVIRLGGNSELEFIPNEFHKDYVGDGKNNAIKFNDRLVYVTRYMTEPKNSTNVSIDVQALVTAVDDGTRNTAREAFSVKIPRQEMKRAAKFLTDQRKFSLENYGYQLALDRSPYKTSGNNILWKGSRTGNVPVQILSSNHLSSSVLFLLPDSLNLTVTATGNEDSPLDGRIIRTIVPWTIERLDGNASAISGDLPPVKKWTKFAEPFTLPIQTQVDRGLGTLNLMYAWFGEDSLNDTDWGYDTYLKIDRIDPFPDMVDIRCSQDYSIL